MGLSSPAYDVNAERVSVRKIVARMLWSGKEAELEVQHEGEYREGPKEGECKVVEPCASENKVGELLASVFPAAASKGSRTYELAACLLRTVIFIRDETHPRRRIWQDKKVEKDEKKMPDAVNGPAPDEITRCCLQVIEKAKRKQRKEWVATLSVFCDGSGAHSWSMCTLTWDLVLVSHACQERWSCMDGVGVVACAGVRLRGQESDV
ncbi:hypothetical protein FISHEDRAFT_58209 [Fistulina hepatica ATCC 64428]|nr:hypothetical protein FISHEDRAFT_58209 [Fistulina hepatica ATCC 64428]